MLKNIVIGVLFGLCCYLGLRLSIQQAKEVDLQAKLLRLQQDVRDLQKDIHDHPVEKCSLPSDSAQSITSTMAPTPSISPQENEQPQTPSREIPLTNKETSGVEDFAQMEVSAQLSSVEKLITLDAEERARLKKRFELEVKNPADDSIESLSQILGDEKYQRYSAARREFEQQMRQESHETELFTLSKKLNLSTQQESEIDQILRLGRDTFFPLEDAADPAPERRRKTLKERTIEYLKKERQRQQFNQVELSKILNEEQYNKYMALQASSAANVSHNSFIENSEEGKEKEKP